MSLRLLGFRMGLRLISEGVVTWKRVRLIASLRETKTVDSLPVAESYDGGSAYGGAVGAFSLISGTFSLTIYINSYYGTLSKH